MTKEGTVLDGKYEIWKEVGRGGMSIVYLARDNRLNKQWAVKEIKNDGSKSTQTLLKGLEREANILKNVDHPVLPRIVDIINQDGTIYVVMDFIEGTTISDRLKKEGAQPQETVIEWGLQLASALDYLHNMNPPVIYRDMKPSNVMIKPEGGVKLIDFGTAKEYIVENNADTTALGTRGYAAPEQFGDKQGRGIYNTDARTDIYNLGATLYHIVTGMNPCEPPYEIRPIREWNPALSSGLEKIILKCTQADPNDRYQNCKELMYALEHYNELDDAYRKKNKKKLGLFITTSVLTVAAAITSAVGYSGLQRIKMDNYNSYIETGNDYRIEERYAEAAEQYKKAFELDGTDAEAYNKYIQTYIDASNVVNEENIPALDLENGLNVVSNRVKSGYDNVDKNAAVLYKLAITYFDELGDYKTATKYFDMINSNDSEYGELAGYYGSVSLILSSTDPDKQELIEQVNSFAVYNQSEYTNQNVDKFINYKTIGRIYATYITYEGVAGQAEQVMNQAVSDLEEYTGSDIDVNDYFYAYYDNLTVIYETLAKNAEDEAEQAQYYNDVITYCEEYMNVNDIKVENSGQVGIGGTNDNVYNTAYYNKISKIAACYNLLGKYDEAVETYKKAEERLGTDNVMSNKIYAEHLDYIYSYCEARQQNPTLWARELPDELAELLSVYKSGAGVSDIESNKTWKKRKENMEMLSENRYGTEADDEEATTESEAAE
ncbi:MAG: protein kinase [Clostridium sp.]|nr:protein kinase [Clostridium sp.]MCM1399100.1 protein kinase [Clostridium sp.]MCM1459492.1 protein kinase [Bacteroides sp.]